MVTPYPPGRDFYSGIDCCCGCAPHGCTP